MYNTAVTQRLTSLQRITAFTQTCRSGQKCLKDIRDTYSSENTIHYQNDKPNGRQRADLNKQSGGLMYLQLHNEVQVVWALVNVLQSHDILMLYPGGGEEKIHFVCSQALLISAQTTNEMQLAFSFVKMMPCQLETDCFLLPVPAHYLYLRLICRFVRTCIFTLVKN